MELSEKQRNKLMEQIYGGYNRSPLMTRGNRATDGADRFHKNAGQIDYYTYGGEASRDYNDRNYARTRDSKHYKETESLTGTTSSHMKSEISNGILEGYS